MRNASTAAHHSPTIAKNVSGGSRFQPIRRNRRTAGERALEAPASATTTSAAMGAVHSPACLAAVAGGDAVVVMRYPLLSDWRAHTTRWSCPDAHPDAARHQSRKMINGGMLSHLGRNPQ